MSLSVLSRGSTDSHARARPLEAIPRLDDRRASVERRLGADLLLMRASEAFRRLGFVRFADYVVERLGLSPRTAQELMRVEAALAALPRLAAARDSGALSSGHVRLLARVATAESEEYWVSLARRLGVHELAARVAETRVAEREEAVSVTDPGRAGARDLDDERGREIAVEIRAPVSVIRMWRDTVAFVRQLLGHGASAGECLEAVLAEVAGDGGGANLHASAPTSAPAREGADPALELAPRELAPREIDARTLDSDLSLLVTERQRGEAALAGHLHAAAEGRRYRVEGFTSLEAYARERFDLSPRHLYHLLAMRRALVRLPALRTAYLTGELTARQARLVGSVATPPTAGSWVRRAASVTLRRLEDEVDLWRHLRDTGSPAWLLLRGGPLPPGLALVPGHAPRLHASAPRDAVRFVRAIERDEAASAGSGAAMPGRTGGHPAASRAGRSRDVARLRRTMSPGGRRRSRAVAGARPRDARLLEDLGQRRDAPAAAREPHARA